MTSTWATGNRLRQSILKTVRVGITRFISGTSKRSRNRGGKKGKKGTSVNALIAVILGAITVYLTYTRYARRMGQARQRLTDDQKTAFFFVTLPEALPIAVISRFIGWFQDFGIPVGGVIVNMVLDKTDVGAGR